MAAATAAEGMEAFVAAAIMDVMEDMAVGGEDVVGMADGDLAGIHIMATHTHTIIHTTMILTITPIIGQAYLAYFHGFNKARNPLSMLAESTECMCS